MESVLADRWRKSILEMATNDSIPAKRESVLESLAIIGLGCSGSSNLLNQSWVGSTLGVFCVHATLKLWSLACLTLTTSTTKWLLSPGEINDKKSDNAMVC